jgi:hypothetical protein
MASGFVVPTEDDGRPMAEERPRRSPPGRDEGSAPLDPASPGPRGAGRLLAWATLDRVWLVAILAVTFAAANGFPVDQTDYWWTVKLGDGLWASGALPATDPLAFTSSRLPYVEQQWLAQVILAGIHRLGGLTAALLFRSTLLMVAVGLLFATCRRLGAGGATAAAACGIGLLLILPGAATRPQLLAIPLFAVFLLGTTCPLARWSLVALPALMVVWVNLHGSFPLGLVLVGIAIAGRTLSLLGGDWRHPPRLVAHLLRDQTLRRLALLLVLCTAAILVNPYGLALLPWLVDFLTLHTGGQDAAVIATEWAPTSVAERVGQLYFLSVVALVAAMVRAGPPPWSTRLRLLAFGLLALVAVRSTLWWGLVQAPALAWALAHSRGVSAPEPAVAGGAPLGPGGSPSATGTRRGTGPATTRIGVLNWVAIGCFAAIAAVSLPALRSALLNQAETIADPSQPRLAAAYLEEGERAGQIFNYLDWGGYLAYRLAPAGRIFVDGRFGIYPPSVYRDYFGISRAQPGWQDRLAAYGIDTLVLHRGAQRELARAVDADSAWHLAYCDTAAAVYRRSVSVASTPPACPSGP